MIDRRSYRLRLRAALRRSPVTALLGPRQIGKTTLARDVADGRPGAYFALDQPADRARLSNPALVLGAQRGLVVLDEVQAMPEVFTVLRALADRAARPARFLILGSASPSLVRRASESLAGRIEFVELGGVSLDEIGSDARDTLWLRGGFPRSVLARTNGDSLAWRDGFIRTFLERDLPQLGITVSPVAMRRFWTMLAHYHAQTWNGSELARAMGLSDKSVRTYLDMLTGAFVLRQLLPWHENIAKRQVKAPKVYVRDAGLLHALLNIHDRSGLLGHPKVGASWEGFVIEQVLSALVPTDAYFWATHNGAELDLLLLHRGRRVGIECKFTEAPTPTRSMRVALDDLRLDHLWVVHPGVASYAMDARLTACALADLDGLVREVGGRQRPRSPVASG